MQNYTRLQLIYVKDYINRFSSDWIYNRKTIQSFFSNVCGHYCECFILFRCRNISLHAMLSAFTSNLTENDRRVSAFIREMYNKRIQFV